MPFVAEPAPEAGLISVVSPLAVWLVPLLVWFLGKVGDKVTDKGLEHLIGKVWELVKKHVGGIEPGKPDTDPDRDEWARQVRERIEAAFAADPSLEHKFHRLVFGGGGEPALWQLPAGNPGFFNRERELRTIGKQLGRKRRSLVKKNVGRLSFRPNSRVVQIIGPAAIGKTNLAVHAAQQLANQYPDGWFYVDLAGTTGRVEAVNDRMVDLLRAQGAELSEIPETPKLALDMFRSWFRDKQALVVVENASDRDQVEAFLPPGHGSAAIVTGSENVLGLRAEQVCMLGPFEMDAALQMLHSLDIAKEQRKYSWKQRSGKPSPAAGRVLQWCGRYPAVISAVAAWINEPGMTSLTTVQIATALQEIHTDSAMGILAKAKMLEVLRRQYAHVAQGEPDAARLFRLVGVLGVPYVDEQMATALLSAQPADATRALRQLASKRLLTADGRYYRLDPFLQRFAERMALETNSLDDCRAALTRGLRHLLERDEKWTTAPTSSALDRRDRLDDLARKRENILAAVVRALGVGLYDLACRLALRFAEFFQAHGYLTGWHVTARLAVLAAPFISDERLRVEMIARAGLNLAAARAAQRGTKETGMDYTETIQRIRELVRFGIACAAAQGDKRKQQASLCLMAARELAEECRRHLEHAFDQGSTRKFLTALDRDIERLGRTLGQH